MITVHLSDPGMRPKQEDCESLEGVSAVLAQSKNYTIGFVMTDGTLTHFLDREVGEEWVIKPLPKRRKA